MRVPGAVDGFEITTEPAGTRGRGDLHPQLPLLARLVDLLEALDGGYGIPRAATVANPRWPAWTGLKAPGTMSAVVTC